MESLLDTYSLTYCPWTDRHTDTHPSVVVEVKNTYIGKVQREGNSEESETGLTENTFDVYLNDTF